MSHFDADYNEKNINQINDIQAVFIQDNEDIFVKNEDSNDASDYEDNQINTMQEDEDIFVNNDVIDSEDDSTNGILSNNLTLVPIVYTTRLDEMLTFGKIEKYTPKEAAVMIQYESKPKYKQTLPINRKPCDLHNYSYMKLYNNIDRLNQKIKDETEPKRKNEELMGLCKPLKIVLKDIKYDKVNTTDSGNNRFNLTNRKPRRSSAAVIKKLKMAEKEEVKSNARVQKLVSVHVIDSDSDSSDDVPLANKKPVNNSIRILPGPTFLAFLNKTSLKADIYIINDSKDLSCCYETDSVKFNSMKKTRVAINTVVLDVCCWVKRQSQIKLLFQNSVANESALSFMRKPHTCLPAPCICCCCFDSPMPIQSSVTFLKMSQKKSVNTTEASKLLRKAYSYTTKEQSSIIHAVDEPISFLKKAVIMMKYKDILFSQSCDLGENYEIGMGGDIDNHVKLAVNRSLTEERELHEKNDRENKIQRQYFSYLICCWYKREEIILKMREALNLSPRALKYLRIPHLCKSHKCQCCCKRAKTSLVLESKNIAPPLPYYKKQIEGSTGNKKKRQSTIDKSQVSKLKQVNIHNKKGKSKPDPPEKPIAKHRKSKKKQSSTAKMVNHSKPETVFIDTTIAKSRNESQPNVAKLIEPPTVPTEFVTSIFNKFKDLKLSINDNGTLTANINTPPEKLSPVEIKVLADILAQASKQMHDLGIEPEEFCRRVNSRPLVMNTGISSELPNLPFLPKLPLPAVIQPSSILSQETFSPLPVCPIVKQANTKDITQPLANRVKYKSPPCKTNKIITTFPETTNSSKIANFYSMMSHTCWERSKCMVSAYNFHFAVEIEGEPEPQLTNIHEQQLPKIINVESLNNTAPKAKSRSKRKKPQAEKPNSAAEGKIRVLPPERLSAQLKDTVSLVTLTKNVGKPLEPTTGYSEENPCNSLISLPSVNGILTASLQNAGNNFGQAQGTLSGTLPTNNDNKIWAYVDGKLVELQHGNPIFLPILANQNIPPFNQNTVFLNTGTVNPTPMITIFNGIPMQVSHLCKDPELKADVKATENVETQQSGTNTMLRDMLTKASPLPLPILPESNKSRFRNALKRPVTPLIQAHSQELKSKKKRRVLNDSFASNPIEDLQNSDTKSTTVMDGPEMNGTGVIQIIDSDEEEESIFGV